MQRYKRFVMWPVENVRKKMIVEMNKKRTKHSQLVEIDADETKEKSKMNHTNDDETCFADERF